LAGEAAGKDVNLISPKREICIPDVFILLALREMIIHNPVTKGIDLAVHYIVPAHPVSGQCETSNSVE
jgi:hypothetical protein